MNTTHILVTLTSGEKIRTECQIRFTSEMEGMKGINVAVIIDAEECHQDTKINKIKIVLTQEIKSIGLMDMKNYL